MSSPSAHTGDGDPLRALLHAQHWDEAAVLLAGRLAQTPGDGRLHGLHALVLRQLRQPAAAAAAAERSVELAPGVLAGWLELAEARLLLGQATPARQALHRAGALQPRGSHAARLARLLLAAGDAAGALPGLQAATLEFPDDAALWQDLDRALTATGADAALRMRPTGEVARLRGDSIARMDHAFACFAADDFAAGHAALDALLARDRQFLPAHWAAFQLPRAPAPLDAADQAAFRARWHAGVDRFAALDLGDPAVRHYAQACIGQATAFYRHYLDDALDAQPAYGAMLAHMATAMGPRQLATRTQPRQGRRRIGFASAWLREHTVDRLFGPMVAALDPDRFEVHVIALGPHDRARLSRHTGAGQQVHVGDDDGRQWAARIAALDLDVLLFAEVGMDPTTQLLAALRLAPVQAMLWGHPVTTGLDTIDDALVPDLLEPADAASHYGERLVRLPGLGCGLASSAAADGADSIAAARERLVARHGPGPHLLCAQTVYKLMPRQDALFARVLAQLPDARLHLIAHQRPQVRDWLRARMQPVLAAHGVDPARVVLHGYLPLSEYRALGAACDLGLDSVGWSGGMSALDLFAAGLPTVAVEGRVMRQRQTAALARALGAGELVAADADDYVRRAVALAGDQPLRARLRHRLREGLPGLLDPAAATAALSQYLATAMPRDRAHR